MNQSGRLFAILCFSATLLLAVALYWSGLSGSFFFDDEPNVLAPAGLHMTAITLDALRDAWQSGISGPLGRPIAQLSFALNHYFRGADPFFFKATNLAIHLVAGSLIFAISRHLLATPALAGLATALWLLNPIQLTSVLYVVQRMTSLSALFLLSGFWLHMLARGRGDRIGVGLLIIAWSVLWPLSCLSKETGLLFPLFVLVWEVLFRARSWCEMDRFARVLTVGTGACILGGAIYAMLPAGQWVWAGYSMRPFTLVQRLLTEGRVLWFYLGLIAFPRLEVLGLQHDDFQVSQGLLEPWTTLPAWVGLMGLATMAWNVRRKAPLFSFGIAWYLVGHLMESTVLPLEIAHEHRNYLPSYGIALVAAWACGRVIGNGGWRKTLGLALAGAVLVNMALITGLRANQFGDEVRRTQIEAQHHPQSARAQYDAGKALASGLEAGSGNSPRYFLARNHFERAGTIDPNFKVSWLGLIYLNCVVGMTADAVWVNELANRLRHTPFSPGDATLLHGLKEMAIAKTLCLSRHDVERIFAAAQANATKSPARQAVLHSWLADYLTLAVHDLPAARAELEVSLRIAPYNSSNRLKFAQLLYLQGSSSEAERMLDSLDGASLSREDAETARLLRKCIQTKCVARRE